MESQVELSMLGFDASTILKQSTIFQQFAESANSQRNRIILELCLKTFPSIVFLVLASIRFCEIRPIGFSKTTVYSKMFRGKVYT
jgi:hypothetical protein